MNNINVWNSLWFWIGVYVVYGFGANTKITHTRTEDEYQPINSRIIIYYKCDNCGNSTGNNYPPIQWTPYANYTPYTPESYLGWTLNKMSKELVEWASDRSDHIFQSYTDFYSTYFSYGLANASNSPPFRPQGTPENILLALLATNVFVSSTNNSAVGILTYDNTTGQTNTNNFINALDDQCKVITQKYGNNTIVMNMEVEWTNKEYYNTYKSVLNDFSGWFTNPLYIQIFKYANQPKITSLQYSNYTNDTGHIINNVFKNALNSFNYNLTIEGIGFIDTTINNISKSFNGIITQTLWDNNITCSNVNCSILPNYIQCYECNQTNQAYQYIVSNKISDNGTSSYYQMTTDFDAYSDDINVTAFISDVKNWLTNACGQYNYTCYLIGGPSPKYNLTSKPVF